MGKKHGSAWDGLKIVYHVYQASETLQAIGEGGGRVRHAAKEATLFVLVLGAATGLLWAVASVVSYVVRVVN